MNTVRVFLTMLVLSAAAAGAQSIQTFGAGEFAELNTVANRTDSRLSVSVLGGEYALAWQNIDQRWAVTGEEKLYVLRFRVRNDGQQVETIEPRLLQILVSDDANRSFDEPLAFRLPDSVQSANARLVQSQSIDIETAFLIPADAAITAAYLADARADRGPGIRFTVNSSASLPRELSPNGVTIDAIVGARSGTWYPLGVTDVRVDGVTIATEAVQNFAPDDSTDIAIVDFSARNRSNKDIRVHRGLYRETSVSTSDGDRDLLGLLFRNADRDTDFPLLPNDEVALRALFKVPKAANVESVDFVEKIGTRGGELSRRYIVGVGGVGQTVAGSAAPAVGVSGTSSGGVSTPATPEPAGPAPAGSGLVTAERTPQPTGSATTSATTVNTTPTVTAPAVIPDEVLPQEEFVTSTAAGPILLDPQGQATIVPQTITVPNADFIVRLKDYYVPAERSGTTDESRPEYQLMVFNLRGRFGETIVTPESASRRDHVTERDVFRGKYFPLSGYPRLRSDYRSAKPFEVMGLVMIMIERDDSEGGDRHAYITRMRERFAYVFYNEFSRSLGVDYNNLTDADATRVAGAFETSSRAAIDAIRNYVLQDPGIGGAINEDEVSDPAVFFWINADDAHNPGIIRTHHFNYSAIATTPFPWPTLIEQRLDPEWGGAAKIRFEISKE